MQRIVTVLLAAALALPVGATTFVQQDVVCPVGGEKFVGFIVASTTTWGQRPDGRPYGSMPVVPVIECPGNGMILFEEEFGEEDVARLTPLVASREYQAMRTVDSPHYRAWWLQKQIGRDPFTLAGSLLVASWDADMQPTLKTRYQAALADAVGALAWSKEQASPWFWLRLRGANALRELGRFDEAAAALAAIDRPDRLPVDEEERDAARQMIAGLTALNAEGNRTSEPANLIPPKMAVARCRAGGLGAVETAACDSPAVKEAAAEAAEWAE